jgi:signal transduction histidine kinase
VTAPPARPPRALRDRLVQPLQRWLVLSHLTVFALPVLALVCSGALATDLQNQTREDISHQAALVALHVAAELRHAGADTPLEAVAPRLTELLVEAKAATLAGFRVVDTAGLVVATSGGGVGEDISSAEEVQAALAGEPGLVVRPRDNSNSRKMPIDGLSRRSPVRVYLAVPVRLDGEIVGAVVLSRTPREELQTFWQMAPRLSVGGAVALALTIGLGVASGLVLSRSLKQLALASRRIAAGQHAALVEIEPATRSRVAEARELALAMATMSARLQERLRYITEFAGNVSHEFKTPVSSLRGTVELLRDDEEMPAEQRTLFLDNAQADLDRLSRLVGGLLRLARAEEGGERRVVPLGLVAAAVVDRHPSVRSAGEAGAVEGNREQLEAALENLVENALRHGGDGVNVRVICWREGDSTGFTVEDDGPGISPANLARVFDRFFTTARDRGGTGLGLALVKAICQSHGGSVEVTSEARRTAFRARFPMAAA